MTTDKFFEAIYPKFERLIILALTIAIMIAVTYATIVFFVILIQTITNLEPLQAIISSGNEAQPISEPITRLQNGLYHVFGGFLLILLGIELISTVRSFSRDNHIKMESIVAIAIIASSRHLITLDYHHTAPLIIFASGFVIIALIVGYFLLKYGSRKIAD